MLLMTVVALHDLFCYNQTLSQLCNNALNQAYLASRCGADLG